MNNFSLIERNLPTLELNALDSPANLEKVLTEAYGFRLEDKMRCMEISHSLKGETDNEWKNDRTGTRSMTVQEILNRHIPIFSDEQYRKETVDTGLSAFDNYICHCTHDGNPGKFAKENMLECVCLIIDVDIKSPGHNKSQFENEEAALENFIKNMPDCTLMLHTGGGFQIVYRLNERIPISGNIEMIEKLWKALSKLAGGDTTCSVGHMFRMPCSLNNKIRLNPRQVKIIMYNPSCAYYYDELESFVKAKGIDLDNDYVKINSSARNNNRKLNKNENPDFDRSYHAFDFFKLAIAKGEKDENRILQKFKTIPALYSHYRDDDCVRRDIRVAMQEMSKLIPVPRNSIKKINSNTLELSECVKSKIDAFEKSFYKVDENSRKTLKMLESIIDSKSNGIISVPCGVGKSTASIILASERASKDYRILYVTKKVDDVLKTTEKLKYLGANALPWYGFNDEKCKMGFKYEKIKNKRFNPCQDCNERFTCTTSNRMLAINKYDNPAYDILVTTHSHYKTTRTFNKLGSFNLVIIDETPMEFEYCNLDTESISSILFNFKDSTELNTTINNFYSDLQRILGTGNCKNISHLNMYSQRKALASYMRKKFEADDIDDEEFDHCMDFLNFICDNTTYYGFMHYESSTKKDKQIFSMIKGEISIDSDVQHIILDGSAKLSDVEWKGFDIYELSDIELTYPNTFLCALNHLPSKSKLNKKEVIEEIKYSISKKLKDTVNPIILLMSNKGKSTILKSNIESLESFLKQYGTMTHLLRGDHVGSNLGNKAEINIIAMSIFNNIEYYVLRAALVSGKEISADRIWNDNDKFCSPKFKKNGGFADREINNAYIRSVTYHLYQAIMRGKIRTSSDSKYYCLFLMSSVEVIALIKSYLPESVIEFDGSMKLQLLAAGKSLQEIAEIDKISGARVRSLRNGYCFQ